MKRIEDFCIVIADSIKDALGDEVSVEYRPVVKNNGVIYHAVLIRKKDENVSPTIYLDSFYMEYRKGAVIEYLVKEVISVYKKSICESDIDVSFFGDFAKVSEHLAFKVMNYEKNKKELTKVPIKRFEDLALVPICVVDDFMKRSGSVVINKQHLDMWEVSEEELWENVDEYAEKNFPVMVKGIEEFVSMRTGISLEEMIPTIFVVSNKSLCNGASAIFFPGVLEKIAETMHSDVLILPSSIHETIAVPSCGNIEMDSHLIDMVKEVNRTTLASEEILSDSVYFYNAQENIVNIESLVSRKKS